MFVPKFLMDNADALFQIMAWYRNGEQTIGHDELKQRNIRFEVSQIDRRRVSYVPIELGIWPAAIKEPYTAINLIAKHILLVLHVLPGS